MISKKEFIPKYLDILKHKGDQVLQEKLPDTGTLDELTDAADRAIMETLRMGKR